MTVFGLLGPVQVGTTGRPVDAGPPRQRCVLAALLVDVGRLVTWETLIDRVWGDTPPAGARHSLYSHAARIRGVLATTGAPARLLRLTGGYQIAVDPDLVDVHLFRSLVGRASTLGEADPATVAALLRQALGLWRGDPLAGLSSAWVTQVRQSWRQQHLDATLAWARAELRIGNPAAVIEPLTDLVREHPLVEPATAVLMLALSAAGRNADALDCYASTRRRLVEELGAEPGIELRAAHRAILRGETGRSVPGPVAGDLQHQLPLSPRGFAGRTAELARLDELLGEPGNEAATVVIATVSGMAGVGKTALAVHWAHRVAARFPDGRMYVNLRGFDPAGPAVSPAKALRGFLEALGMPAHQIPAGADAKIVLYRGLLAGRRVLILLDNARDIDQVRQLLPGAPGCLVLVTSRNQLPGLAAAEGAHPIVLSPLHTAEARQLLAHRLGAGRMAAEPDAVDEIISRCGRLPLALAVAAARAATHPAFPLAALAGELRDAEAILDGLGSGDPTTDVRAVFSSSYRTLSAPAARLFRLLALHPGPHVGAAAAASLAGAPVTRVRPPLAELARAHLIVEHVPGRFGLHDLLRAFAAELVRTVEPEAERGAATHRMLDHYLQTACSADVLLYPHRDAVAVAPAATGVTTDKLRSTAQALDWLALEHPALVAAVDVAVTAGMDTHAWQLAWFLSTFWIRQGHGEDQVAAQRIAVAATQRLGNRPGQACVHLELGRGHARLRQYDAAHLHLTQALELFSELDDLKGQADAHFMLGFVADQWGSAHEALRHAQRCRDLYQIAGDLAGQARAANALGLWHRGNGKLHQALSYCRQAVALHRKAGDQHGVACAVDSVAQVHARLGQHRQAIACFRRAIAHIRDAGDRYNEATILTRLGDSHHSSGDTAAATTIWTQALNLFTELAHPDAELVRDRLTGSTPIAAGHDALSY